MTPGEAGSIRDTVASSVNVDYVCYSTYFVCHSITQFDHGYMYVVDRLQRRLVASTTHMGLVCFPDVIETYLVIIISFIVFCLLIHIGIWYMTRSIYARYLSLSLRIQLMIILAAMIVIPTTSFLFGIMFTRDALIPHCGCCSHLLQSSSPFSFPPPTTSSSSSSSSQPSPLSSALPSSEDDTVTQTVAANSVEMDDHHGMEGASNVYDSTTASMLSSSFFSSDPSTSGTGTPYSMASSSSIPTTPSESVLSSQMMPPEFDMTSVSSMKGYLRSNGIIYTGVDKNELRRLAIRTSLKNRLQQILIDDENIDDDNDDDDNDFTDYLTAYLTSTGADVRTTISKPSSSSSPSSTTKIPNDRQSINGIEKSATPSASSSSTGTATLSARTTKSKKDSRTTTISRDTKGNDNPRNHKGTTNNDDMQEAQSSSIMDSSIDMEATTMSATSTMKSGNGIDEYGNELPPLLSSSLLSSESNITLSSIYQSSLSRRWYNGSAAELQRVNNWGSIVSDASLIFGGDPFGSQLSHFGYIFDEVNHNMSAQYFGFPLPAVSRPRRAHTISQYLNYSFMIGESSCYMPMKSYVNDDMK
jgi:hypothetical protein